MRIPKADQTADRWRMTAGSRTVDGGADLEEVFNFARNQYAVVPGVFRF